ncbi:MULTISPECIES: enoyl-[acyl-carrier-protein] reductase FabK [unclassified Vagococcus]|uniref:enoyl-[acyl-carrier-protein] reductase FabK n=1 Tax=unclassified Vagococcus TaxID=2648499 RepID=UPI001F5103F0|nr:MULTISPECIES: enoyl-[acyl-carrier-protein] reductase FabK [unclassified Vagococcus]MCI0129989.1 enoyl-[acyl-carrier-protein] reductase FabK [Vagococcus sp. CY53-2]UNM88836.1 enoyl-[acyl-carrier-protein] reductase FabK [Vagococcus sp. CY52-2]
MKQSTICQLLNIEYPVIQGAMAWVAEETLASAVSNAGGLGLIASGHAPKEVIQEKIQAARTLTDKTFGVNIMLMSPFVEDIVDLVIEERVKVITTGAGSPGKYMKRFKEAGIIVIPVVASVAQAKRMEKEGADAVVVEGMEGGGHIGKSTTMTLVPQVADAVSIPVIAAGGIGDGRGVAAALMLGAQAVQLGTRFLVSKESIAHNNFKTKVVKAKDIDTVVTGMLTGHPVRGLRNKLTQTFEKAERVEGGKEQPDFDRLEDLGKGALKRAVIDGDIKNSSMMAGQIAGMIKTDDQTCEEIIQELIAETQDVLKNRYTEWILDKE